MLGHVCVRKRVSISIRRENTTRLLSSNEVDIAYFDIRVVVYYIQVQELNGLFATHIFDLFTSKWDSNSYPRNGLIYGFKKSKVVLVHC